MNFRWSMVMACVGLLARPAAAAGPLGPDGAAIRTSRYGVDLTQGPVTASTRVMGLAGAYVALAEGVDGNVQNPAAPAVRPHYSVDFFDYDLGLGLTLPGSLTSTDFFNTGRRTSFGTASQNDFVFLAPAANLQWQHFGFGVYAEIQNYGLTQTTAAGSNAAQLDAEFLTLHLQAAYGFFAGQWVIGAGARVITVSVVNGTNPGAAQPAFATEGAGFEIGTVLMPHGYPFRIGASFRSAVPTRIDNAATEIAEDASGDRVVRPVQDDPASWVFLPTRTSQPWDLNLGVALQLGPRPFNVRWVNPKERLDRFRRQVYQRRRARLERQKQAGSAEAEAARTAELEQRDTLDTLHLQRIRDETRAMLEARHARLQRRYVLLTMSLVVTGATADSVGVESFLSQTVARSGRRPTVSPRFGIETELIPRWLKVRAGAYGEPSRFASGTDRLHGTFGFDTKLFPWTVFGLFNERTEWRAGAALDIAQRYLGWGASVGVWH